MLPLQKSDAHRTERQFLMQVWSTQFVEKQHLAFLSNGSMEPYLY
jgi:hypothetical protein